MPSPTRTESAAVRGGPGTPGVAAAGTGPEVGRVHGSVIVDHAGAEAGAAGVTSGRNTAAVPTAAISLIAALVVARVRDRPAPAG